MRKIYIILSTVAGITLLMLLSSLLRQNIGLAADFPIDRLSIQNEVHAVNNTTQVISQAQVVVQFDAHNVAVRGITFNSPINSLQALKLAGMDVITQSFSFGVIVCTIGGVGDCSFSGGNFWKHSYWDGHAWVDYLVGADAALITQTNSLDGWHWGPFDEVLPPANSLQAAVRGLDWIRSRQVAATGGYTDTSSSADAALAVGANDLSIVNWRKGPGNPSLFDFLVGKSAAYTRKNIDPDPAARAGKLAMALAGSDGCWPFGAKSPLQSYDPATGAFDTGGGSQAFGMLGTLAFSSTLPARSVEYLKSLAQPDGGWKWALSYPGSDSNSTALSIQALAAAGEPLTSTTIISGLAYLKSAQNSDSGFMYQPGSSVSTASDANSTAYAIQAILASGQDPTTGTWKINNASPINFLLSLQFPDGSFSFKTGTASDFLATSQAVPALFGRTLPYKTGNLENCPFDLMPLVNVGR